MKMYSKSRVMFHSAFRNYLDTIIAMTDNIKEIPAKTVLKFKPSAGVID